jgi:hypothetical protein
MPNISTSCSIDLNHATIQSTRPNPSILTTQQSRLSKVTRLMTGILALRSSVAGEARSIRQATQTGITTAVNNTHAALNAPFVYSGSSDATHFQIYDLQADIKNSSSPSENSVANAPYRIVSTSVPSGDLTVMIQAHLTDLNLFDTTDGNLKTLATGELTFFAPSAIHLSTIGHSPAGIAYSAYGKPIDSDDRTNLTLAWAPCFDTDVSETGFQLQEFSAAGWLEGHVEHALPLPTAINNSSGYIPNCGTDSADLAAAVIYRHESGGLHLAHLEASDIFYNGVKQDFDISSSKQATRLSYLSASAEDHFLVAANASHVMLFSYRVSDRLLEDTALLVAPSNTTVDIDIPLISSRNHIYAAGASEQKPVLIIFARADQNFMDAQTLNLSFLDSTLPCKIIGLDAADNKILLLIAATKENGEIELQNWEIDVTAASAAPTMLATPTTAPMATTTSAPTHSAPTFTDTPTFGFTENPTINFADYPTITTPPSAIVLETPTPTRIKTTTPTITDSAQPNDSASSAPTAKASGIRTPAPSLSNTTSPAPSSEPSALPSNNKVDTQSSSAAARTAQVTTVFGGLLLSQLLFR